MRTQPIRELRHDPALQPFIVIWEVTRACQLSCAHCRADAIPDRHPRELSTSEGRALLDDLSDMGPPAPLVVLTGGDPFERPDLLELIDHGVQRGLNVSLAPSVTPSVTPASLGAAADAGVRAVSLSLDGATARTHDRFRGIDGVFEATSTTARWVREAGLRLQLNTTVTARTVRGLPAVLDHAVAMDAGLWSVFFLVPTGRGADLESLDADEVEQVLHWLHDVSDRIAIKTTEAPQFRRVALQRAETTSTSTRGELHRLLSGATSTPHAARTRPRRPPLDVNAGKGFVFVDHLGTVYPSGFLPVPAGSVRATPLREIYRDAPLMRLLRDPGALRGRCGACEFAPVCGGSRSRAYAATGEVFAEDPSCSYVPTGRPTYRPGAPSDPPTRTASQHAGG